MRARPRLGVDGLVSHGLLRRYAWTLDFERMTMTVASPD